ncbi:NUDIX hydrolase [Marinibaculum pumilum]|uniref:NUDIX hydrolase n=1 Tax=Marinibaculum pumilum TaxID=1766165 RepID=A0ABV7L3Z7_9PROT
MNAAAADPDAGRILCSGWWPAASLRCSVDLDRPVDPPADLAGAAEAAWQNHLLRHPADFDGRILHLLSWSGGVPGEAPAFRLAPMRFAFQAARRAPDLQPADRARLPGPIGLSVIPRTADGKLILARRSDRVSIAQRSLFFFGGFGEPPASSGPFDLAAEALRELHEELGTGFITRDVGLLGLGERPRGHQHAVFLADLDADSDTVLAQAGEAADAFEWDRLWAFPPAELLRLQPAELEAGASSYAFEAGRILLARHLGLPEPVPAPGELP